MGLFGDTAQAMGSSRGSGSGGSGGGKLYGIGCGPGDPELLTLKAVRLLGAADVIAFPASADGRSRAMDIARGYVGAHQELMALTWPMTGRDRVPSPEYEAILGQHYQRCAAALAQRLRGGASVALLCLGDPILYGSFMHFAQHLQEFAIEIIPGITSPQGSAAAARRALCHYDDVYQVVPAVVSPERMRECLLHGGALVIIKLGAGLRRLQRELSAVDRLAASIYVEQATCEQQKIAPLSAVDLDRAPYFSLVLVPSVRCYER